MSPTKPTILIVDDEPDGSEFVARYLQRQGYATRLAPNGFEAVSMLVNHHPDAVVLDVRMPGMDGIELLHVMRSYLRWLTLPVIILTAHATAADEQRALQ